MRLTVLGSGDAFSSGGRFPSCYQIESGETRFLLDCGPSILPALKRAGISTSVYSRIFISHLHGDHIGGLPFFLLDAMFPSGRQEPLTLIGPAGLETRLRLLCETMYPRFLDMPRGFDLKFIELDKDVRCEFDDFAITPFEVSHFSGAPSFAFRFEIEGKIFAFSGDTGWTDNVVHVGRDADLYLIECCHYDLKLPMHLDYRTISENFERIGAKKYLLTHMSDPMLVRQCEVDRTRCLLADDGMVIDI